MFLSDFKIRRFVENFQGQLYGIIFALSRHGHTLARDCWSHDCR